MERLRIHTEEAHLLRDSHIRDALRVKGTQILMNEYAESLHETNALLAQRDRYPADLVKAQEDFRLGIYNLGRLYHLDSLEVDHICEDEYLRRQEEARARSVPDIMGRDI